MSGQDSFFSSNFSLNLKGELYDLSTPKVMGILNITADSFYDGGKYLDLDRAMAQTKKMLHEGADFIDVGAASSRPGAKATSAEEELKILTPYLEKAVREFPEATFSIDTYHAKVAAHCIEIGAHMINDISAGEIDDEMMPTAAKLNCPYIMMHMQGTPQTMQDHPQYDNVVLDVAKSLAEKIEKAKKSGIVDLIVDPGFGFGKTLQHNFELLNQLSHLSMLNCPILVGISRKSMIYKTLKIEPAESLNGTTALHMIALENGAKILRVHDVKEAKECLCLFKQLKGI